MDVRLSTTCPDCGTTRSVLAYSALSADEHCYLLSPCGHRVHQDGKGRQGGCDCVANAARGPLKAGPKSSSTPRSGVAMSAVDSELRRKMGFLTALVVEQRAMGDELTAIVEALRETVATSTACLTQREFHAP